MKPTPHERKIHERYEWMHILNDFLSSVFFIVGCIIFLLPNNDRGGDWFFLVGSCQMIIGPFIRLLNKLHVKNIRKDVIHW